MKTVEEQLRIIRKGVHDIIGEEELRGKLERSWLTQTPLTVKLGLDPSAPDIHLGHAVVLRKIKQMQDLGHRAVIIIGDFTGRIGDPTGRSKTRQPLTEEQVSQNAETYRQQIYKILDMDKTIVVYNSSWLNKLNFAEVLKLSSITTVARMLERDDFKNRFQNNRPIGIHEFFYPLMQGYDSVETKADIEIGGTDQTFNILMGRTVQKSMGMEQQTAVFMPILEGLDGVEKMSKSLGNYIGIQEEARVMFKKVMEIPDELIVKYYELATDVHPDEVEKIKMELSNGTNPRDIKLELAKTITHLYHNEEAVEDAIKYYELVFVKKILPEEMSDLIISLDQDRLIDIIPLLVKEGYAASNSDFRRLYQQGGVQINMDKADDLEVVLYNGDVLKIGKKKFVRIVK